MSRLAFVFAFTIVIGSGCGGCDDEGEDSPERLGDLVVENCENGEDDDGDGLTDCEQPVCQLRAVCVDVPDAPSAPPVDGTGIPNFVDSVRFLWEGDDPVIRGLNHDLLDERRLAVIRGKAVDASGEPVSGLRASIVGEPGLGYTYSREDGAIDLVANGDREIVVRWEGENFPAVDRVVAAPTLDYAHPRPVVVTPYDEAASSIDLREGGTHVATVAEDDDGARAMRLYFEPDTVAEVVMPDGRSTEIDRITVRATEFTIGETGLDAMPAALPELSAYTYAAELTVDEARRAGAATVHFSKPVTLFLDNFLDLEAGTVVPNGLYDRARTRWAAAPNGVVAERVDGGLDIDGDGAADDASALAGAGYPAGVAAAAREFFDVGDTFWLASVPHFTPCDLNFPYEFPEGAVDPDDIPEFPTTEEPDPCEERGSIIECQNQVLGKSLPLPGTNLRLNYRSDRVVGRGRSFEVRLSHDPVNEAIEKITVDVEVAGRYFREEFEPEDDLVYHFDWDGLDAYGRQVTGKRFVRVRVGYWYLVEYTEPDDGVDAFAGPGVAEIRDGRLILPRYSTYAGSMGGLDARSVFGLGGWQLSSQHGWDANSRTFYPGTEPERASADVGKVVNNFETFDGVVDTFGFDPRDGARDGPAIHVEPDGSMWVMITVPRTNLSKQIWRRNVDGSWEHVAGNAEGGDTSASECLDRLEQTCETDDARNAPIFGREFAVHPDGEIYLTTNSCIWRIRNNRYEALAGDCLPLEQRPDRFPNEIDLTIAPDGEVFVSDNDEIFRLVPDENRIETFVGCDPCEEDAVPGESAVDRDLDGARLIAAGDDGIFFTKGDSIKFVDWSGRFSRVYSGAESGDIRNLAIDHDGDLHFMEVEGVEGGFIKRLRGDGTAETVAGATRAAVLAQGDGIEDALEADGVPATSVLISIVDAIGFDAAGRIFYSTLGSVDDESNVPLIKVVESAFGDSIADDEIIVPSLRATQMHVFDERGLIRQTRHALANGTLYDYEYDGGTLSRVVDPDVGAIEIERDASGAPSAIVTPGEVRTELVADDEGYLAEVRYPDGRQVTIESSDGLITSWSDGDYTTTYDYDPTGRLTRMEDAAGGWKSLTLTRGGVLYESSAGTRKTWSSTPTTLGTGEETTITDRHGLEWVEQRLEFENISLVTRPDGTVVETELGTDPRFGPQAFYLSRSVTTTPSELEQRLVRTREYEYSDPDDRRTVTRRTDVIEVNGEATTNEVWDVATRTRTTTTPEGRVFTETFDELGRLVSLDDGVYNPVEWSWYDDGRPTEVRHGDRWVRWERDTRGFATQLSHSAGIVIDVETDEMGRIVSTERAGRTWMTSYDPRGNLSSFEAPGGPTVGQIWNERSLLATSDVPGAGPVTFESNVDRRITKRTSPGGSVVDVDFDDRGRSVGTVGPNRTTREYDPDTGQVARLESDETALEFTWDGFLLAEARHTFGPADVVVRRTFDDHFRVVSRSVGGTEISYAFDRDGFKTEAGGMSITRGEAGEVTETEIGEVRHEREYDENGWPIAERYVVGGTLAYGWTVTYDDDGQIITATEEIEGVTTSIEYDYDELNRLQAVRRDGVETERYLWDGATRRVDANGELATYDGDGRLTEQGPLALSYDDDGNVATIDDGGATTTFTHDALGRLSTATTGTTPETRFIYDARGHRVGMVRDGTFERGWIFDDHFQPIAEVDAAGDVDRVFVYALNANVPNVVIDGNRRHRLLTDWRGSVRLVVDTADGTVVQRREYDEFGVQTSVTGHDVQPFAYAGGLDVGLDELWAFPARNYAPELGRWLEPDPTGLRGGTADLWSYVGGDPINNVDPRGRWMVKALIVVVGSTLVVVVGPAKLINDWANDYAAEAVKAWCEKCPGNHNGPGDAIKHCTLTCELNRDFDAVGMGREAAKVITDANEYELRYKLQGEENPKDEKWMDDHNNNCGNHLSDLYPDEPCYDLCEGAYHAGDLVVLPPGRWSGHWWSE